MVTIAGVVGGGARVVSEIVFVLRSNDRLVFLVVLNLCINYYIGEFFIVSTTLPEFSRVWVGCSDRTNFKIKIYNVRIDRRPYKYICVTLSATHDLQSV